MIKETLKKAAIAATALATVGGASLSTAAPADAAPFHGAGGFGGHGGGFGYRGGYGGGYGFRGGFRPGYAIGAGLLGVAIGASLANPYYGPAPAYYAGPGYWGYDGACRSYWQWDARWGRYVRVDRCY